MSQVQTRLPMSPPDAADVFACSPLGTLVATLDGDVLAANPAAMHALGRSDLVGCSLASLADDPAAAAAVLAGHRAGAPAGGLAFGAWEGAVGVVPTPPGRFVVQLVDLSARRAAEAALQETEAHWQAYSQASPHLMWECDYEGRLHSITGRFEAITGMSVAEALAGGASSLVHPDDLPATAELWIDALRTGTELRFELRVRQADGSYRWMLGRMLPERDDAGRIARWFGVAADVEDAKQAEAALRSSAHLNAVGQLAAGVAHEVNNMMAVVMGFGSLLVPAFEPGERRAGHVREILAAAKRTSAMTRQLLAFGRRQVLQPETHDLGGVLSDLDPMVRRLITQGVDLKLEPAPVPTWVLVDRAQVEQVVVNLALNARDAMPGGGRLVVRTRLVQLRARRTLRHPGDVVPAGSWVVLEVRDTGVGMDGAVLARALEPFFTTKPPGQGTGLGLSTVYGIIRQSGGYLGLQSEAGRGTRVEVWLPAADGPAVPAQAVPPPPPAPRATGGETLLVVDDEDAVRRVMAEQLRSLGYRVIEADNGAGALDLLAGAHEHVHGLLTDLVMPGMSGRDLADRARRLRPGLPVLHVSGQADEEVIRRGLLAAGDRLLEKPFTVATLAEAMQALLHP